MFGGVACYLLNGFVQRLKSLVQVAVHTAVKLFISVDMHRLRHKYIAHSSHLRDGGGEIRMQLKAHRCQNGSA